MQCTEYSKTWLNLTFAAVSLTFIRGHKAFPVFHTDQVIIRLPCNHREPSRIWKVQGDWLSLGKECCSWLRRYLWGRTKYELPHKCLRRRLKSLAWISSDCFESFSPLSNVCINQLLMPSSDVTTSWKPGSDFDWLIV